MAKISLKLRNQVTQRANRHCEYCQTSQLTVIEMVLDHIVPESAGGQTTFDNLCLSCISCNSYKHDFQDGIDPLTGETAQLYNPRIATWSEHFIWTTDGALLIGLTA